MADVFPSKVSTGPPSPEINCSLCPCGSVCIRWQRFLVLHLEYGDLLSAIACLDDILATAQQGLSLGGNRFCACHAKDGCYYLLCLDRVVLRLSEHEARALHRQLCATSIEMKQNSVQPKQVM